MVVIEARDHILGRLASNLAKRLLQGEDIDVVNAEGALLTGRRLQILARYRNAISRGNTKRRGPYYPRTPHLLLKRTIRGMLPYQTPRGREAFKRLHVHLGVPDELKETVAETIPTAMQVNTLRVHKLGHICRDLGWKDLT